MLGDVTYDDSGSIIEAKATTMTYFLNSSDATDLPRDDPIWAWEQAFLDVGEAGHPDVHVSYLSSRSFNDESARSIGGDASTLSSGYLLLIVFVMFVIGKFNCLQQRMYVTLGGILCIGLAIGSTIGACSYAGIPWGPMNGVLPFLLLGIGVDDMFVIVQCYDQFQAAVPQLPVEEKIALAMKHAGMSILVTSVTDICAFAVGATTIVPALRAFCIYCALGILANFLFQATLFVACVTIDQRRYESARNACCCCYKHKQYSPNRCSQRSYMDLYFLKGFGPLLTSLPVKILVFCSALLLLGGNIYGVLQLEQDFDYRWFFPSDSYAQDYFAKSDQYFPEEGKPVTVYLGDIDYFGKHEELLALKNRSLSDPYTASESIDAWFDTFITWVQDSAAQPSVAAHINLEKFPQSKESYYTLLHMFLKGGSREGSRFMRDIVFENDTLVASRFTLMQKQLNSSLQEIQAMDNVRQICDVTQLNSSQCFVYATQFLDYEGNKVIQAELYRNLALAFICVLIMTLILLANLWACVLVCLCVIMSLIDVGGFMYFWGLTIDTVTTINLLIAIGLTVDYSTHIAHTFMTCAGTRNDRVVKTLGFIGPAVLYGGFSTFLAFVLLCTSGSYVFQTFFKVFLLVVSVGLFHGLLFLPVLLSWIGPPAYRSAVDTLDLAKKYGPAENGTQGGVKGAEERDVWVKSETNSGVQSEPNSGLMEDYLTAV